MSINAMHFKLPSRFEPYSFLSAQHIRLGAANKCWCTLQLPVFNRKIKVHGKQPGLIQNIQWNQRERERAEEKMSENKTTNERTNEHSW